jgi:arylformamidase
MGGPIFLGYDQEALDREYDNRGKVPDFADYFTRYAGESAVARRQLDCRLDVRYGPSPGETLDIFPATGSAPIQLFIHGGYWRAMDKADFSYVARAFNPAGAAVVVINYALIPAVDMDELIRQCRAAVACLSQCGFVRRRSRAPVHLRPLGGRASGGDVDVHRLAGLRWSAVGPG